MSSSLSALLGTVTFMYAASIEDLGTLKAMGIVSAIFNLMSNLGYRIRQKADKNLAKWLKGELRRPTSRDGLIIVFALLGAGTTFYFGTYSSLKLVDQLFSFVEETAGSQKWNEFPISAEREQLFKILSAVNVPFSLFTFFLAQSAGLLKKAEILEPGQNSISTTKTDIQNTYKRVHLEQYGRPPSICSFGNAVKFSGGFGLFLIPGEMLGYSALSMNSAGVSFEHFITSNPWAVGIVGGILTVAGAIHYYKFNIVDWIDRIYLSLYAVWLKGIQAIKSPKDLNELAKVLQTSTSPQP